MGAVLSVAMVVFDDERVVAESIESVRPIADEIAVLGARSAEPALDVAERLGATVHGAEWADDLAALRNRLLHELSGQWVLWLEPGDRLTPGSAEALADFLHHGGDPGRLYCLMVEAPPDDTRSSTRQIAKVRLMPNRSALCFEGRVGETLKPSAEAAGLGIGLAPGRIVRHPRERDPAWKAARANRDLELAIREQGPDDTLPLRALLVLGDAAAALEDWPLARQSFAEAIQVGPRGSTEMLAAYYGLLATFRGDPADCQEAIALGLEAIEVFPLDAQLLCIMGDFLQASGRSDLAARAFDAAFRYGQVDLQVWHAADVGPLAAVRLSAALRHSGREEEARRALEEALERWPLSGRVRRELLEIHVEHGRTVEALRLAERLPADRRDRESLRNAVRGACRAARGEWEGALDYLQRAWRAGCRDRLCLRGLVRGLLATGQVPAAEEVLGQWRTIEPGCPEIDVYQSAVRPHDTMESASNSPDAGGQPAHWLRIDPGSGPLLVGPMHLPIISQVSSLEATV